MPADPRDNFDVFAESEQMFFGLRDPYALIRNEVTTGLRRQVPDTEIESIATFGDPKFLTLGKKLPEDENQVLVSCFGFCVRARIALTYDGGQKREELPATLTFVFARVDEPGKEVSRSFFDLHGDAEAAYEGFDARFMVTVKELRG